MTDRPRNIANDILDCVETATAKWTRQKKSEERHPGNVRYRASRMTREPRTTQKEAAWEVMEAAYMAASANDTLPAKVRQIYYQARPKIMAMTDDKELGYNYFSQTLMPDYIEEHGVDWDVVYDARGHFEEPHTNRNIGCGTLEVRKYLAAVKEPEVVPADFAGANVDVIGPSGNFSAILYCEKEGFGPLFKAVKLADRYDLMIISNKGNSVTAGRKLIDDICGDYGLPLFVLHDFDLAGFVILGTLQRDTRRYQFSNAIEVVDLGLRLDDIAGLEREPAAATRTSRSLLRAQLAENGASAAEIDILLSERVELNAMTSDALVAMIESKLEAYGLEKVVPDEDLLEKTYRAFHRSQRLRERFMEMEQLFDKEAEAADIPDDLEEQVRAVLAEHRFAVGRRYPARAGRNAAFSCASREGKGREEIRGLHERQRRRPRRCSMSASPRESRNQPSPTHSPSICADHMRLERCGRLHVACCQYHSEKTPFFTVYKDRHFYCFACQAHGSAGSFLRRIEGLTFAEAREARERVGDAHVSRRDDTRRSRGTSSYATLLIADSHWTGPTPAKCLPNIGPGPPHGPQTKTPARTTGNRRLRR